MPKIITEVKVFLGDSCFTFTMGKKLIVAQQLLNHNLCTKAHKTY